VSVITMHNSVNRAFRDVLGLARLMEKFDSDISDISGFLQRQAIFESGEREHARNRRFWFFSLMGTGVLAALTVSTLVKEGLESWRFSQHLFDHGVTVLSSKEGPAFMAFIVGTVILIGTCVVGLFKRPPKHSPYGAVSHQGHGLSAHAGADFAIHKHRE
jgi:hypothetical protein